MAYAKGTEVSVAKSQAEIQNIIMRYGATTFIAPAANNETRPSRA